MMVILCLWQQKGTLKSRIYRVVPLIFFLKGTWNQSGKIAPSLKMHLILIQLRNTRDCWAKPNLSRQIFFGWSLEIWKKTSCIKTTWTVKSLWYNKAKRLKLEFSMMEKLLFRFETRKCLTSLIALSRCYVRNCVSLRQSLQFKIRKFLTSLITLSRCYVRNCVSLRQSLQFETRKCLSRLKI